MYLDADILQKFENRCNENKTNISKEIEKYMAESLALPKIEKPAISINEANLKREDIAGPKVPLPISVPSAWRDEIKKISREKDISVSELMQETILKTMNDNKKRPIQIWCCLDKTGIQNHPQDSQMFTREDVEKHIRDIHGVQDDSKVRRMAYICVYMRHFFRKPKTEDAKREYKRLDKELRELQGLPPEDDYQWMSSL